jgi:uncharacterized delta-60 repeat protein
MKIIPPVLLSIGLAMEPNPTQGTPGDVDPTFDPDSSIDNAVLALAPQADSKVLIAGAFTSIQGALRGGIARLNTNGLLDTSFMNGLAGANNFVWTVALQADGKPVIGGFFSAVNGAARNCVARLNTDGSLDNTFLNGLAGANGAVYSVAAQPDGKVLIAGNFTSVNQTARNYIARLNADGSLDNSFLNGLAGGDTAVFCMRLQADGKILIGGWFTLINGVGRNHVARLNSDGSLDNSFLNNLPGADGRVWSMALQPDNRILIGGDFLIVNGAILNHIARLNTNGTVDNFVASTGMNDSIWAITVQGDGKILAGGQFTSVLGISLNSLARFTPDGLLDGSFLNGSAGPNGTVRAIGIQSDGKTLIGGQFTMVNSTPRSYLARLLESSSAPRLGNVRVVNGQFSFSLGGEPGRTVIIQASSDLQNWASVATNLTGSIYSDPQSPGVGKRFYRLVLP